MCLLSLGGGGERLFWLRDDGPRHRRIPLVVMEGIVCKVSLTSLSEQEEFRQGFCEFLVMCIRE